MLMSQQANFKISTSLTDFAPLFLDLEYVFKRLKETGVDGIELVIGIKSRWSVGKIKRLSERYALPITSVHQPIWSGLNLNFDENFVDVARELGTNKIVCHPLTRLSLQDKRMRTYLGKLARLQQEKGVEIMLENMSPQGEGLLNSLFPSGEETGDIEKLFAITKEFGLKMTIDIDHLSLARPHEESWFAKVLPHVGNIHLSSFTKTKEHLPLYMGDFKAKEFLAALERLNYKGLLTLEIFYPSLINPFSYNFADIKKSIAYAKNG